MRLPLVTRRFFDRMTDGFIWKQRQLRLELEVANTEIEEREERIRELHAEVSKLKRQHRELIGSMARMASQISGLQSELSEKKWNYTGELIP